MAGRLQKATEGSATRRRRTQRYKRVTDAVADLDAFKAANHAVLAQFTELATEYNAAVTDMEKHLRAHPERVHLGPFKAHFRGKNPPTIDFNLLLEKIPELLTQPGVVRGVDLVRAREVAERMGCPNVLEEAVGKEESLVLSKPKTLQLDWPAA